MATMASFHTGKCCVGWHVTLCDPVCQMTTRSSQMEFQ